MATRRPQSHSALLRMIVDIPVMIDPSAKLRVEKRAEEEESDPGRDDTALWMIV
jgi:hypothetical protein